MDITANLDVIESLCEHNKKWSYHGGGIDGELILKEVKRIRERMAGPSLFSGERGRISATIDSGVREAFYRHCDSHNAPRYKSLERALLLYLKENA